MAGLAAAEDEWWVKTSYEMGTGGKLFTEAVVVDTCHRKD